MLANFLQTRMIYGLKIEEERQIFVGNSANGELGGLCNAAAAYTRGATNQSLIDCLANAKVQLELNEYTPDGVILNPIDFLQCCGTAKKRRANFRHLTAISFKEI